MTLTDGQVGAIIGGAIGFVSAVVAEPLRQWFFRPVLELTFGPEADFITHTPVGIQGTITGEETYLRVRVRNKGSHVAKQCRAFLTEMQHVAEDGRVEPTVYCDSIQLAWSVRKGSGSFAAQDLAPDVPYFFDLVALRTGEFIIQPKLEELPFRYHPIFYGFQTYQFGVMIAGDGVAPARIRIRAKWSGDRNAVAAWVVPPDGIDPAIPVRAARIDSAPVT